MNFIVLQNQEIEMPFWSNKYVRIFPLRYQWRHRFNSLPVKFYLLNSSHRGPVSVKNFHYSYIIPFVCNSLNLWDLPSSAGSPQGARSERRRSQSRREGRDGGAAAEPELPAAVQQRGGGGGARQGQYQFHVGWLHHNSRVREWN